MIVAATIMLFAAQRPILADAPKDEAKSAAAGASDQSKPVAASARDESKAGTAKTKDEAGEAPLKAGISNTHHVRIQCESRLFSSKDNTVVDTPFGTVNIIAGSVVLLVCSDNSLAVYNLHDMHKNAVVIHFEKETIAPMPWCMGEVAKSSLRNFEEANQAPFVKYRHVKSHDVNEKFKIYQAEFDMTSMVSGLPPLRKLMISESEENRKTMASMLKTTVIMAQVSQSSEPYVYYWTPKVRAAVSAVK